MIVRGGGLEASMSRYLIDRIRTLENVDILVRSEMVELHGDGDGLKGATIRNRDSGSTSSVPVRQVFMFIGAEPNTAWLNGCLALDDNGYILTGRAQRRRKCRRRSHCRQACPAYSPSATCARARPNA